jgi:carbamoyl-phosphate synthase small subunit
MLMEREVTARLVMENGSVYEGKAFGSLKSSKGEVVFATGMTGYQETLTDPSFAGQMVVMTYPLIGNYGLNLDDMESEAPSLRGFIVREKCDRPNNWRCEMDLDGFLKQHGVVGLEGIDTRSLTKLIRKEGTMKGAICIGNDEPSFDFDLSGLVKQVTCKEKYSFTNPGSKYHIAVLDLGVKANILRELSAIGCRLSVYPAFSKVSEILEDDPDAVFLTNGPGDPKDIPSVIEVVKDLMDLAPVLGICLGHQLIALASGCDTEKLVFGHHGCNHPVKDLRTGQVHITSQNHNYVVSRLVEGIEVTHANVNDNTIEGIRHVEKPVMSVQFHPEACPGPVDTRFLFKEFLAAVK